MESLWPEKLEIDSSKTTLYYYIIEEQGRHLSKLTNDLLSLCCTSSNYQAIPNNLCGNKYNYCTNVYLVSKKNLIPSFYLFTINYNEEIYPSEISINQCLLNDIKHENWEFKEVKNGNNYTCFVMENQEMFLKFLKSLFRFNSTVFQINNMINQLKNLLDR